MAQLIVSMHGEDDLVFALTRECCVIGRAHDAAIRINDPSVSLHHARISFRDEVYVLADLGSTNGTRINGHYVLSQRLGDADRIRFGQVRSVFQAPPSAEARIASRARLLRVTRQGQLIGYFSPENARENLRRGRLRPDDRACHDS